MAGANHVPLVRGVLGNVTTGLVAVIANDDDDRNGYVLLENRHDGVHCLRADPVIWFTDPEISGSPLTTYNPWVIEDDCYKLIAINGTWIWKLTGRTWDCQCGAKTILRREGVWPD